MRNGFVAVVEPNPPSTGTPHAAGAAGGKGAKLLMRRELEAARHAVETGVYCVWRSSRENNDCTRVGPRSRCFCGHPYKSHMPLGKAKSQFPSRKTMVCNHEGCGCKGCVSAVEATAFPPDVPLGIERSLLRVHALLHPRRLGRGRHLPR